MRRRLVSECARELISLSPLVGVRARPPDRPEGISAIVRVKDEEEWVEPAIRSLVGFADQIIVGDNGSTDRSPQIVSRLRQEFPDRLEVLSLPDADICQLTNALIERSRYRWLIRWDADCIAQTNGPYDISQLKAWLLRLPRSRYYLVYVRMVELAGDLWHQDPRLRTRADAHVWTASSLLRYVYGRSGYEAPEAPPWYAIRHWDRPCLYHLHVKSDQRLFLSHLWKRYLVESTPRGEQGFVRYTARICETEFGGQALKHAATTWTEQYIRGLVPFDAGHLPDYPALLRPYLERPRYRIQDVDGKIVGRTTVSEA